MRTLYHLWMSPFCRKARIFLGEKRLEHELRIENIWERREEFLALNPAGTVPVLVEIDGTAISGADVICEFHANIHMHLTYLSFLVERRRWLAGDDFSMADVAAAAHLSCVDYLGDVPWEDHPEARDWYARLKSRPSMRSVLSDRMPGFPPPRHYADLDF